MKPRFLSRLAAVAGALAAPLAVGAGARAESMHADYHVSLIGLPIGVLVADSSIRARHYHVDLNVRLVGIASLLSNLKMALASSGIYRDGTVEPTAYATTASNSRETRTLRMAIRDGAVRKVQYSPAWDDNNNPDRVPLTPADKRDIIDPLSAFIMTVPRNADPVGPAACNRRVPVFDGYTRFDITLHYVGVKEIKSAGYTGPVSVCSARYIPIAGHKRHARSTEFMADNKDMHIWLAPVPNRHIVVPYRVSLMTMAGTAVIEAEELRFDP